MITLTRWGGMDVGTSSYTLVLQIYLEEFTTSSARTLSVYLVEKGPSWKNIRQLVPTVMHTPFSQYVTSVFQGTTTLSILPYTGIWHEHEEFNVNNLCFWSSEQTNKLAVSFGNENVRCFEYPNSANIQCCEENIYYIVQIYIKLNSFEIKYINVIISCSVTFEYCVPVTFKVINSPEILYKGQSSRSTDLAFKNQR